MNFKPNAWTLLFVLALGGFIYQTMNKPPVQQMIDEVDLAFINSQKNCKKAKSDTLNRLKGASWHLEYSIGYRNFVKKAIEAYTAQDTVIGNAWDLLGVVNPDVNYFKIPTCELYQMLKEMPAGTSEVYAYLAIAPIERTENRMIDLVFYQERLKDSKNLNDIFEDGDGDGTFYDFSKPCPPLCDTSDVVILN